MFILVNNKSYEKRRFIIIILIVNDAVLLDFNYFLLYINSYYTYEYFLLYIFNLYINEYADYYIMIHDKKK